MKNILLITLLFCFTTHAYSQSDSEESSKFRFGITANLNETQIKNKLFGNSIGGDASNRHYGIGAMAYLNLKRNWYVGLGGSFNVDTYLSRRDFEKTQVVSTPVNAYEESMSNLVGNYKLNFKVALDESRCFSPRFTEDYSFRNQFATLSTIQSIGIPILLGKTMGKKRLKFYTEITLRPMIITKKEIKFRDNALGLYSNVHASCIAMGEGGFESIRTTEIIENEATVIDYNIRDSRLDAMIELGVQEQFKKMYYKVGVFYGESLTPFTSIEEKNIYGQMLGVKLEFGLLGFS